MLHSANDNPRCHADLFSKLSYRCIGMRKKTESIGFFSWNQEVACELVSLPLTTVFANGINKSLEVCSVHHFTLIFPEFIESVFTVMNVAQAHTCFRFLTTRL